MLRRDPPRHRRSPKDPVSSASDHPAPPARRLPSSSPPLPPQAPPPPQAESPAAVHHSAPESSTDTTLTASDERALHQALTALLPEMRGFARFLARDRSAADDLVQDTVVRVLAALPQFQPGTSLKAWVFTIERNAFYEQARRSRREQSALRQRFAEEPHGDPPQDSRTDLTDLQRLLFALPPLLREALVLVGAQEMSHEAAAAICGVPVGTMKARVSRGRAKLAAIMADRVKAGSGEAETEHPAGGAEARSARDGEDGASG